MKKVDVKEEFVEEIHGKYTLKDTETGSQAILPLIIDDSVKAFCITLDKGAITGLQKGQHCADNLVSSEKSNMFPSTVCLVELKGTGKSDEVDHAVKQLKETLTYLMYAQQPSDFSGSCYQQISCAKSTFVHSVP